jgi:hypothetical protein
MPWGKNSLNNYYDSLLEGAKIKELLKVLLEKSGYTIYPYGYETTFSDVRKKLNSKTAKNSRTARRIKSSPDLLVYDVEKNDVSLVEVKMRRAPTETKILIYGKLISAYKEFWNDSILIVVVPCGHVFYAQRVSELMVKESYNAVRDFQKLEDIFCKVIAEDILHFREQALQIMEK